VNGLLTDLYQLTMAAGYFEAGKSDEIATFEMFVRRLPQGRHYLVAAGLPQAVEYLETLQFRADEVAWLRSLPQFSRVPREFWSYLLKFRFTGSLAAAAEGTAMHAKEPLLVVRAPLIEAQLVETYLLSMIGFQTLIATKAAHLLEVADGRPIVEFGSRRAHGPQAGLYAARAAYIGGCVGTSNVMAGYQYGIPLFGTSAHSWVLAFDSEREAFRKLQDLLGDRCAYLVDTYDSLEGTRKAASLGKPIWGVRLDSGNIVSLAKGARKILDEAGLRHAKIMATNELDEVRIREILAAGAPVDVFGVGTALATSSDSPALGAVYKLVEIEVDGVSRYPSKKSEEKATLAGAKQVFRYSGFDVLGRMNEEPTADGDYVRVLKPVMANGRRIAPLPSIEEARAHAQLDRPRPGAWVDLSAELLKIQP
jgi:nicotinate phosphoribosyltransferase